MINPIKAILIGAGIRGMNIYGDYAMRHPDQIKFVAVAEPDPKRRRKFSLQHKIPPEYQFEDWEPLLQKNRFAEAALVCTQDQMHFMPTMASLQAGYDVLLEKPMAHTINDCERLVKEAEDQGRQLHICHVLRYTKHFQTLKSVIKSGVLGDIVNVSHRENVAWWHMAESYVRGAWRNESSSAPMILTKCCHDLDILTWLLDDRCTILSSVGGLFHYRLENAPTGATRYCLDGCAVADSCRYYAPLIYIDRKPMWQGAADTGEGFFKWATKAYLLFPGLIKLLSQLIPYFRMYFRFDGWPSSVVMNDPSPEKLMIALKDNPHGRCVYYCDNDVVDHQVVSMQFECGTSVSLTMHGHSHIDGRTTRIEGSNATLKAEFTDGISWIEVRQHHPEKKTLYPTTSLGSGHGGGDDQLMAGFIQALHANDRSEALTTARNSLESHLMAFAAEDARSNQTIVHLSDYR